MSPEKITAEGLEKLKAELESYEAARDGIAEEISTARERGDLSENSEYDAAKEKQAANEARIAELKAFIANAIVVSEDEIGTGVSIGSAVEVQDQSGRVVSFTIVSSRETDSLNNRISTSSPIGAALIGHEVGDEVSFTLPNGTSRTLTVLSIARMNQEDANGAN